MLWLLNFLFKIFYTLNTMLGVHKPPTWADPLHPQSEWAPTFPICGLVTPSYNILTQLHHKPQDVWTPKVTCECRVLCGCVHTAACHLGLLGNTDSTAGGVRLQGGLEQNQELYKGNHTAETPAQDIDRVMWLENHFWADLTFNQIWFCLEHSQSSFIKVKEEQTEDPNWMLA